MATSGTYDFNPSLGELALQAYSRIGVRRADVSTEQMQDARVEANLLLAEFANRGPNLWTVDAPTIAVTAGVATYPIPPETVDLLSVSLATSDDIDRVISPLSRTNYAEIPNKLFQGRPTGFWFNRLAVPAITLWPVPDGVYTLKYWRYRQNQDATLGSAATVDITYLFTDAFVAGLAHRLARMHAPALEERRQADADRAWNIAAANNTENVPLYITPMLRGYYR